MKSLLCKNIHSFTFIFDKAKRRRGVAPIIATLLLVAIATVGGSTVFAFSQDAFNTHQVSGSPNVELIKFIGYDGRDVANLCLHNGNTMSVIAGDPLDGNKNKDERIAVFVVNHSVHPVIISEIRLGGAVYSYSSGPLGNDYDNASPDVGEYVIMSDGATIHKDYTPILQPGEYVTLLLDLDRGYPVDRDVQFRILTSEGNVFVGMVMVGTSFMANPLCDTIVGSYDEDDDDDDD